MARYIPVISVASIGVGILIENKYEIWNRKRYGMPPSSALKANNESSLLPYVIPTVSASSSITAPPQPPINIALQRAKPIQEIMKYGYPSLENVKSYDGFVVAYDKRNRVPYWVFEKLNSSQIVKADNVDRSQCQFHEDTSIHEYFRATNKDYKGSGYDRGHLAAAGNHRWSQSAMEQTFTLSNMSPQVGTGFNRDGWNTLEKYVRHLTKSYKNVYVCTGPLYLPRKESDGRLYVRYEVIGPNQVAVPTHFFKVILCEIPNAGFDLYSFVMPNQKLPAEVKVHNYLFPLETVERASGLHIFGALPKNQIRKINGHRTK